MLLHEKDLAQRAIWILECIYGKKQLASEPSLSQRVLARLGSGPVEAWGKFTCSSNTTELLAEHARTTCLETTPLCNRCELRKFCAQYRDQQQHLWQADSTSPTVVDLFCGAGGASLGFVMGGFKVLLAIDVDDKALLTYRLNHPELPEAHVVAQDLFELEDEEVAEAFRNKVLQLLNGRTVDVVVGGPPCQGFSQIGSAGRSSARSLWSSLKPLKREQSFRYDPKNKLYRFFLMIVEWLRPRFCIMENVPAMIHIGGGRIKQQVISDFESLGYYVPDSGTYNALDYGVPQRRQRAFFLGARDAFARVALQTRPRVMLGDAIQDLPPLTAGMGSEVMKRTRTTGLSAYATELSSSTMLVHNHVARPHMESDLRLYAFLNAGQSIKDRPDLQSNEALFRYRNAHRFRDIYTRQSYDAPSSTVISHLSKDGNMFIHPEQVRTYTVREAARVQSFPDDYIFCGSRTAQFIQVGNAIPPLLVLPFADLTAKILGNQTGGTGMHTVQTRLPI